MIWKINIPQEAPKTETTSYNVALPELKYVATTTNTPGATPKGIAAATTSTTAFLDVVKNFYWTYSKPESREEVPTIYLKEKKLKVNALISQLKYSLGFAGKEFQQAAGVITSTVSNIAGKNAYSNVKGFADAANAVITSVANAAETVISGAGALLDKAIGEHDDPNAAVNQSKWLAPYRNLYLTESTGWEFLFPYFDDGFDMHGNSFSSEGSIGGLGGLVKAAADLPYDIAEIAGFITNPKQISFVERAKFYNFPTEGETITFSFPLINTGSVDYTDVVNNWQLLFLLLYNNKPGRISPVTVEQPVIYEVEIPGVKFYPYCYISNIDIKFQGSRRELTMEIPFTKQSLGSAVNGDTINVNTQETSKTIKTIVPDAYFVTITLKSMLGSTKNFMYHLLDNGSRTRGRSE